MHTKSRAALARSDRLTPEDLLLEQDARLVWRAIFEGLMALITAGPLKHVAYRLQRHNDRSDPLALLGSYIVLLANAGVSEARLRMLPLYLTRVIEECFAGNAHRTLAELDVEETRIESHENQLATERLTSGAVAPELLEEEALANEQEAAVQLERARLLRRQARQARTRVLSFPTLARR